MKDYIKEKKIEKNKNFEKFLKKNTINNINFLIDSINLLIRNAYTKELINIKLDEYILNVINAKYDEYSKKCNKYEVLKNNDILIYIKNVIGYYFDNLSPIILNSSDKIIINNELQCALHMYFSVNFNYLSYDDVIKKYYDYYYELDNNKCELFFDNNILDNNIKKSILLNGIYIFINKCIDLKVDFNEEYCKHIKQWSVKIIHSKLKECLDLSECPICLDYNNLKKIVKTDCNHCYCFDCFDNIKKLLKPYHVPLCPLCRTPAKELYIYVM